MKKLAIVIPCFNEEAALPATARRILDVLDRAAALGLASPDSFVVCVDDGSRDDTWGVINRLNHADPRIKGISLAHNRGHQAALLAGLTEVRGMCDAAVSIDADLQDDPDAIIDMARHLADGCDIVYGVRASRATDTAFKRNTARMFYRLQRLMGLEIVYDHADYRLLSATALDMLADYGESNLYLRGIVPHMGLQTAVVSYDRSSRVAGESKYPLSKQLALSVDGITSFTAKPMRYIFFIGLALLVLDILVAVYVLISYFRHSTIAGWTSIMLSLWFLGSLILIGLGVIGEYIGKIYTEVKHRPRFAISRRLL